MMLVMESLQDVMKKDFQIIREQKNESELIQFIQASSDEAVFIKDDDAYFHISVAENDRLVYERCGVIDESSDLEKVVAVASKRLYVLMTRDQEPVGYLDHVGFFQYMYDRYKDLRAFIKTILETTDESVTVVDQDERVVAWTKGAEKLFSLRQEDVLGQPITGFFKDHHLEILNTLKGTSVHHKQQMARDNQVVVINTNHVRWDDDIMGAVVTARQEERGVGV